jgi:uncharacterized protein DUF4397
MTILTGKVRASLLMMLAATLVACGGSGDEGGADPKVRLLNLSTGYSSLDLMTNNESDDDDDDEDQLEDVALDHASEFVTLDPDNYTIKLRRSGSGAVLRSFAGEALVEDTVNLYVAYGEVGQFGALKVDESLDDADPGEHTLHIANVSSAGALDIYLTDANTDLDDTTPVMSSVGAGLQTLSADSGTYRLRATAANDTDDVRLDIPAFSLSDEGVSTLIFTATQGGMLANAVQIPQQGQPTRFTNTKARVRAAVALANGANVSINVNGTRIITTSTAGVIGSRYTLFDAGSLPVTLTVNGVAVAAPNVTLTAGADYTLMVWSNSDGPQTSLINDDNRLPAGGAGVTKIRLLNGMSTLAAPLTLTLDNSPLIEGVLLGDVSDEEEVTSGTDRQFDISNTSTAAPVLTRSSITLQGNSVYTFFMTDNGGTPIGVLRKDR